MAGLTATITDSAVPGAAKEVRATLTADDSYPANGYAYTPALFGLSTLDAVTVHGTDTAGTTAKHDPANEKIKLEVAGVEVEAEVDVHTVGIFVTAKGR